MLFYVAFLYGEQSQNKPTHFHSDPQLNEGLTGPAQRRPPEEVVFESREAKQSLYTEASPTFSSNEVFYN